MTDQKTEYLSFVNSKIQNPKTKILEWDLIADDNKLPYDFFKDSDENVQPNFKNFDIVRINFNPNKSFGRMQYVEFELNKKFKTIGTYITKLNKLAIGINPYDRRTYQNNNSIVTKSEFGIKKINANSIKIFEIENDAGNFATIEILPDKNFKIQFFGDYLKLDYFVTAICEFNKWDNRIDQLVEFDENNLIVENPKFYFKYQNVSFEIGNYLPDDLTPYRMKFVEILCQNNFWDDAGKIAKNAKPIQFGGGKKWLDSWLIENNLRDRAKPLT